jgi:hypothetical protein
LRADLAFPFDYLHANFGSSSTAKTQTPGSLLHIIFVLLTAFTPGTIYDAVEEACFVLQVLLYKFKAALKPLSWTVLIKSPGAASKHLKLPSRYLLCNKYCVT